MAPGEDTITNTVLKFLPVNKILELTNILNEFLRLWYFHDAWKRTSIISIPKTGKNQKIAEN